jgi:hypothetical protein
MGRGQSSRYQSLLDRGFSEEEQKALLGRYVPSDVSQTVDTTSGALGTPYDFVVTLRGVGKVSLGEIPSDLFQGLCRKHLLKNDDFTARGSATEHLGRVFIDLVEAGEALNETALVGRGVKIAGRTVRLTLNIWRGVRLGQIELDPGTREKVEPVIRRYPLGSSEKFLPESATIKRLSLASLQSSRGV